MTQTLTRTSRTSNGLRGELLAEVAEVRFRVDRAAGDTQDRLLRRELATQPIEVLAQPFAQLAELALFEALVELAEVILCALPDLHRDHVAERVGREVAETTARPVHVLEYATRVVGNVDPEILVHLRVPGLGEV